MTIDDGGSAPFDARQRAGRYLAALALLVIGVLGGSYTGSLLLWIIGPLGALLLAAATYLRDR